MAARSQIRWTPAQKARLRTAITKYNRAVTRLEKQYEQGVFDYIPRKTTVEKEMGRIHTRQDLYQREKELLRILKTNNPDAQNPVEYMGRIVPKYLAKEIEYAKRVINAERRKSRLANYPSWDEMTAQERAEAKAKGNIDDLHGEYYSGEDLEDLVDQKYRESDAAYFQEYVDAWHAYCAIRSFEDEVVENIEWLLDNRPGAIRQILDRGDYQAKIEYIYEQDMNFGTMLAHHRVIIDYWERMREFYE